MRGLLRLLCGRYSIYTIVVSGDHNMFVFFFFLRTRHPPNSTLFPYPPLSRSLMLMPTLKPLEPRARRDQLVMGGGGFFLLLAASLARQSLARLPLYALQAWLCCSALAVVA